MISQQPHYTIPPVEHRPDLPPPVAQQPGGPEYNEQFIEMLAQRLLPRLMPEMLYQLRVTDPMRSRNRILGMSLALAIVSLALLVPLIGIVLGVLTTTSGGGIGPALLGIGIVGVVMVLINVLFNYLLFHIRS